MQSDPGLPNDPCTGFGASQPDLEAAILPVASSIELATSLRASLNVLSAEGRLPVAPHRSGFDTEVWRALVAYLVEERRLTEFLLGPSVLPTKGNLLRYKNPDDICLDCFRPPDGRFWRFQDSEARTTLRDRANRVNKRLTHFSWTLTQPDIRSDHGIWSTHYLNQVIGGLHDFSDWLEATGSSVCAEILRGPTTKP